MALAPLTPLNSLRISRHLIPAHDRFPNSSISSRPLLIYHEAFDCNSITAEAIESHLSAIGVVVPRWTGP